MGENRALEGGIELPGADAVPIGEYRDDMAGAGGGCDGSG